MKILETATIVAVTAALFACPKPADKAAPAKAGAASAPAKAGAASAPAKAGAASAPAKANTSTSAAVIRRGADFTVADETALTGVIADPSAFEGKTVKVRGKVAKACAKKGCWMELQAQGTDRGVRVSFKDYAFFVPLDSAGSSAVVEGAVSLKELDDAMAKHLEEEGARIQRNADGQAVEIALVATAVELRRN